MRDRNPCEVWHPEVDGAEAQKWFERSGATKIDNRTPAAVASGLSPAEWKEMNAK